MRTWLVPTLSAIAALAAPLLVTAPASATPPPPPRTATNCDARVYVIDDIVCATPALLALDRQVGEAFAETPDSAHPEHPRLVDAQTDWYWRSRQCFKASDQPACLTAAYEERLAVLAMLRSPPAAGEGTDGRCDGAPWGDRSVKLNRTGDGPLVVSDLDGVVLAVASPPNRAGWTGYMTLTSRKAPWKLKHYQGLVVSCAAR